MYRGLELKSVMAIALTVVSTVFLDQLAKALIIQNLTLHDTVEVIPGFFNIVYWRNPGGAFGILKEGGTARTLFFVVVSLAAVVIIGVLVKQHATDTFTRVALSLVAGGAVGNLIDRLRFGEVVDFLDFYLGRYHWPAFNVADSAITVGVLASLFLFYIRGPSEGREEPGGD
jgi:signal peptidase II